MCNLSDCTFTVMVQSHSSHKLHVQQQQQAAAFSENSSETHCMIPAQHQTAGQVLNPIARQEHQYFRILERLLVGLVRPLFLRVSLICNMAAICYD